MMRLLCERASPVKELVFDPLSAGRSCARAEQFFGILGEKRLLFKADSASQADYLARGMGPFTYEMKGKTMTMAYHEVPPEILEQPRELVLWAVQSHRHRGQQT
jgi:DNA transformation protein